MVELGVHHGSEIKLVIKHITFLDTSNNYGQVLQCYALQRQLIRLGHDAKLIRFRPSKSAVASKDTLGFGEVMTIVRRLVKGGLVEKFLAKKNATLDKRRDFVGFISEYISCTKEYDGIGALRENPPEADVYLCGSDQIWGKSLLDEESAAWFLDFGGDEIRRVAYAPSIGREYAAEELPVFKRYLSRLQFVSTREESAAQQCQQLGFRAAVVVDPTLLLRSEDYLDLASGIPESASEYLFAYILNVRDKNDVSWREVSRFVSASKLKIRAVYSSGYYQARSLLPNVEPERATVQEWIAAIRDARYVITTSFHGTVFCILLHKTFIVFPLRGRERANDRLVTLLSNLGLEDRLYTPSTAFKDQMMKPTSWEKVDERLESLRACSRHFLEWSLKGNDCKGVTYE